MQLHRQAGKVGLVAFRQPALSIDEIVGPRQLSQPDGRTDVRHPVVVANHVVPVFAVHRKSLALEMAYPLEKGLVVGRDHSALTGRNGLVAVKAEGRDVAENAHMPALESSPDRLGAILDEEYAVLTRQNRKGFHVAWMPVQMHCKYRLGARADLASDVGRIHLPGVRQ